MIAHRYAACNFATPEGSAQKVAEAPQHVVVIN